MRLPDYSLHQAHLLGGLEHRVAILEEKHVITRKDVDMLLTWARRIVILGALWGSAIGSHLAREPISDALAQTVAKLTLALIKP